MATHRRTASDSIPAVTVFVPHPLSFAGADDENEGYFAAQRYDWADVPAKLTEPRVPYEPTQPFDYILPKKGRGKTLGPSNANGKEDEVSAVGTLEILKRKVGRPRRLDVRENQTPAASVEPDGVEKPQPKRRGRPPRRLVEANRKTDDGDNSEDESYVQPNESWKAGTKRRGPAPQHPPKRPRTSRTVDTDEEQETGPLRSGGARSRATPIKPQQANRWSATEDRQLIDSLFDVLGSIPWRRVTAFMAEKGYSCADRGEGAIRGRWKVLRPRLYIAPPTVVRGAAAKSQLKAREREENTIRDDEDDEEIMEIDHKEPEPEYEHEHEHEREREREHEAPRELQQVIANVQTTGGTDAEATGGGDTTAEDDDIATREADAERRERAYRKRAPPTLDVPGSMVHAGIGSNEPSPAQNLADLPAPVQYRIPSPSPPTPPSIPPPPPPRIPPATQTITPNPLPQALPPHSPPSVPVSLAFTSPNQPFQHSTPNLPRELKEPRVYSHHPPTSRLEDHPNLRARSPFAPPTTTRSPLIRDAHLVSPNSHQRQLSPQTSPRSTHKLPSAVGRTLPPLSSQLLSPPSGHVSTFASMRSPTHLPLSLTHQGTMDARHLPPPQPFIHEQVWPARPVPPYEASGERSYERGYESSPTREYQISGERGGGGGYTRSSYAPLEDRHTSYPERSYVSREERTHDSSARYERNEPTERKSRKPEMLPFPLAHDQRPTRYQSTSGGSGGGGGGVAYTSPSSLAPYQTSPPLAFSTQVFPSTNPYSAVPFTTRELIPGQSRLPVLGERTPSPRRKRESRAGGNSKKPTRGGGQAIVSSQESEIPDSTAGSSDGGR
ncbi:hypothetical protein FRC09_005570 [Ceratobasidium sp. 395]|nr:hypothetical protein FRC09_005570 [Ceratobasidium sp. 395]